MLNNDKTVDAWAVIRRHRIETDETNVTDYQEDLGHTSQKVLCIFPTLGIANRWMSKWANDNGMRIVEVQIAYEIPNHKPSCQLESTARSQS